MQVGVILSSFCFSLCITLKRGYGFVIFFISQGMGKAFN